MGQKICVWENQRNTADEGKGKHTNAARSANNDGILLIGSQFK